MIAAIYARRSKEQDDADDETKSVNRQVENARVFATAKGWTVLENHIYNKDDGISGASAPARLRDKARMRDLRLNALSPDASAWSVPRTVRRVSGLLQVRPERLRQRSRAARRACRRCCAPGLRR